MRYHKQIEGLHDGEVAAWNNERLTDNEAALLTQCIQDSLKPPEGVTVLAIAIDIQVQLLSVHRPAVDTQSPKSRLALLLDAVKSECVKMADYGSAAEALMLVEKIRKETP